MVSLATSVVVSIGITDMLSSRYRRNRGQRVTHTNRILVVDADNDARRSTGATLTRSGFDVLESVDGQEAIDLVRNGMPLSLPDLDGERARANQY